MRACYRQYATVFPRLGALLKQRNLTVAELERQIGQCLGVPVDREALDRLADPGSVRQADLEAAGAAASILGVGLNDLFDVVVSPSLEAEQGVLAPDQSRRLAELFDRQSDGALSDVEQAEMETLVAEHGRRLREYLLGEVARKCGVSIERAREESDAAVAEALASHRTLQDDPKRLRSAIAQAKRRAARASA